MAQTLIQLVTQALGELGLPVPAAITGATSGDAVQYLALMNREGKELADREGGWPALRGEQSITLVPAQEAYDFPTDLAYYRHLTAWDRSTKWRVYGPLSDREWQQLRSGLNVSGPWMRYRIMNGKMHFDPVPTGTDTIVFEYISANWALATDGTTTKAAFSADTDTTLLPEDLMILGFKWRLLAARGMNYAEERAAYDAAVDRKQGRTEVTEILPLNRRAGRYPPPGYPNVPDGNWPGP